MSSETLDQVLASKRIADNRTLLLAVSNIADRINYHLRGEKVIVICVMKGALVFCGHLLPLLNLDIRLDYVHASRYGYSMSGSKLQWFSESHESLREKSVLIVDDICDEGKTLNEVKNYCIERGARDVYAAVLINRTTRKNKLFTPDFIGINLDNTEFVFGFGIDCNGCGRNLPDLYAAQV